MGRGQLSLTRLSLSAVYSNVLLPNFVAQCLSNVITQRRGMFLTKMKLLNPQQTSIPTLKSSLTVLSGGGDKEAGWDKASSGFRPSLWLPHALFNNLPTFQALPFDFSPNVHVVQVFKIALEIFPKRQSPEFLYTMSSNRFWFAFIHEFIRN